LHLSKKKSTGKGRKANDSLGSPADSKKVEKTIKLLTVTGEIKNTREVDKKRRI